MKDGDKLVAKWYMGKMLKENSVEYKQPYFYWRKYIEQVCIANGGINHEYVP